MARTRHRRETKERYVGIPRRVLQTAHYFSLSFKAKTLLLELAYQYNGHNNGDLTCAFTILRERGWKSRSTIDLARRELEAVGYIEQTRQGGKHKCNLYALTWRPIDHCDGKLDVSPTTTPSGLWKTGSNPFYRRSVERESDEHA